MSSIMDVSSMYNYYSQELSNAKSSSLDQTLKSSSQSDEELMSACKSFETYFVQKLIEEEKKTLNSDDDQGEYMQYFGDTLTESYAQTITDSGQLGLAKQLYDSMQKNTK